MGNLERIAYRMALDLFGNKTWKYYQQLRRSQWADKDSIHRNKTEKLRLLLRNAYDIPMYRELWDNAGVKPQDVKVLEDLEKIPIIRKEDLRSFFPDRCVLDRMNR